jgi:UDP-N-acetylglucosamine 2-epimerase (non-hydrolysing)
MRALLIFGARPNYMKIAPLYRAMRNEPGCDPVLVNTGQHFDAAMSSSFVQTLGLPAPDIDLNIGQGSPAQQISRIMEGLETVMRSVEPDVTVVVGDVNSTLAAALASSTVGVPVAHVEAGLRSRDWSMPEERNRVLTDRLSRFLFTPSAEADENLKAEGIEAEKIFCVGNVMIDSIDWILPRISTTEIIKQYAVGNGEFALATLHRPANVDDPERLAEILRGLDELANRLPVCFPVHPRTQKRMAELGLSIRSKNVRVMPPLPYTDFVALLSKAALVVSDSGGVQEESTVLGTPCLTIRQSTERPITLKYGLNELVEGDSQAILSAADRILSQGKMDPQRPPLWDGHAAKRTVDVLCEHFDVRRAPRVDEISSHGHLFAAVILAGGIRPSPLIQALGQPTLCLPINDRQSLLTAWLDALQETGGCESVTVVVSSESDATAVRQTLEEIRRCELTELPVKVIVEPARWRGTGGIMRDVASQMIDADCVLMVEGTCLPPAGLHELVNSLQGTTIAAVGVSSRMQPAGAFAVLREAFQFVPAIGFFDIKEQLLPALYANQRGAKAVEIAQQVVRLRSREGYLLAVASLLKLREQFTGARRPILAATVSPQARVVGSCLIARGVVIEPGAVVHDSIVLEDAVIRSGAVVSRSVIGAGAEVQGDRILTSALEPAKRVAGVAGIPAAPQSRLRSQILSGQR